MLTQETQQLLAKYINQYILYENQVEKRREELAQNLFFEPFTVFSRLDHKNIQYFSIHDLRQFFTQNHIPENEYDLQSLIRKMDTDKDQYISFSEFSRYILPHNDQGLNQLANNRVSYHLDEKRLPLQVEKQLLRLFQAELHLNNTLKKLSNELKKQNDWDKIKAWELVNSGRKWDTNSLFQFLEQKEILQIKSDIENFIYRNSRERDYRIHYSDFLYMIYTLEEQTIYKTPVKKNSSKQLNQSQLQQTNYRTSESTNFKSDNVRQQHSQSYHESMKFQRDVEVSEFTVEDDETNNILLFLLAKKRVEGHLKQQSLTQLFRKIDIGQKNYITLEDLLTYFKNELHKQIELQDLINLVKILDKNKDGVVSAQEFHTSILEQIKI